MRLFATLFAVLLALPVSAQPYLYWATDTDSTIARANLDGSGVDLDFITDQARPWDVVVDDTYIYWTNERGNTIGRARLDGSEVEPDFITGAFQPRSITRDDTYLYWNNLSVNAIGRARLDGSEVDQLYVPSGFPGGLAVSDTHIYWSTIANDAIRRSNLDGSDIDDEFVSDVEFVTSLVVEGDYLYWGTASSKGIGRVRLDGSDPTPGFIPEPSGVIGLASDGSALYAARSSAIFPVPSFIDRVNLDGSGYTTLLDADVVGTNVRGVAVTRGAATASEPDTAPVGTRLRLTLAPNPASATATLSVEMIRAGAVRIGVYDLLGRRVAELFDGALASGSLHTVTLDTAALPAGVYVVRARTDTDLHTKRLVVVH